VTQGARKGEPKGEAVMTFEAIAARLGITVHQAEYAFNRGIKKIRRRCPYSVAVLLELRDELEAARQEARKVRQ